MKEKREKERIKIKKKVEREILIRDILLEKR